MAKGSSDSFRSAFRDYSVVGFIGEGGSGKVYEVASDGSRYALKVLDPSKSTSEKLKRFQNEIKFCQETDHRNIVRVLDAGRSASGSSFYVMDLYPRTLQDLIGKIKPDDVLPAFSQILDGVETAHQKMRSTAI